jgi:hypothetical protein
VCCSNDEERDREKRAHMVAHLEPLLVRYQVSLCLWGHVHKFERTCPLANFTCHQQQDAGVPPPVHAVIGETKSAAWIIQVRCTRQPALYQPVQAEFVVDAQRSLPHWPSCMAVPDSMRTYFLLIGPHIIR